MRFLAAVPLFLGAFIPTVEPALPNLPFGADRATTLRGDWARALDLEPDFTNSVGMKFVLIPGGRFDMGPNGSRHRVTLAKAYSNLRGVPSERARRRPQ